MGKKTSIYLPDDLAEAVAASGASIPDLIRAGLAAGGNARETALADQVERLLARLDRGYRLVAPDADLAAGVAELAGLVNKLAGQTGT